jgi:hypothetical protein
VSVEPAGGVAAMLANLFGAALLGARGRPRSGASRPGAPDVIDLGAVAPAAARRPPSGSTTPGLRRSVRWRWRPGASAAPTTRGRRAW